MSASSARKYIETKWLRGNHYIDPLPEVLFENIDSGGVCWPRQRDEVCINGRYYNLEHRGLIICNTEYADDDAWMLSTLAHEWRHEIQKNMFEDKTTLHSSFSQDGDYKQNIIQYFSTQWWEMDALLYAWKMVPDEVSELWMRWLGKL